MPKARFFYGWWIVGVALAGECLGNGSLVTYTFGCFLKPLAKEFAANRGRTALALSLTNFAVAISAPLMGRLSDRFGVRRIVLGAILGSVAAVIAISGARPPLWHLYLAFALAGLAGAGAGPVTYRRVVVNWFDRRRGLALGLASLGLGLGAFVMPLAAQALIDRSGWRRAYLTLAVLALAIVFPLVAFFFKERPAELGLRPDGASGPEIIPPAPIAPAGASFAAAVRTGTFWQLCFIFGAVAACVVGTSLHLVAMLTDRGLTPAHAALIASLFGLATLVGRVVTGGLIDRVFAPRVMALFFGGAALGLLIFWQGAGGRAPEVGALLLGLGVGAETDVMPYLVSRYFGLRAMGAIFGSAFSAHVLGVAAGGYLLGAGFDAAGSYRLPLGAVGLMLLVIAATLGLRPYAGPASRPAPPH